MSQSFRYLAFAIMLGALTLAGCSSTPNVVPLAQLRQSQHHATKLHSNTVVLNSNMQAVQTLAESLAGEKQSLMAQNQMLSQQTMITQQRVDNLMAERDQLKLRFASLSDVNGGGGGLPGSLNERFRELANRFPDFEFDPVTGVSRFREEILFSSGSDVLRSSSSELLREFADILNSGDAQELRILVAGHTDDQRIIKAHTHQNHTTNWHLSTNRANSVVLALKKYGMAEGRMGALGYGKFQPMVENLDDTTRQQNRRVEIYVLAPEADTIASWDPLNYR